MTYAHATANQRRYQQNQNSVAHTSSRAKLGPVSNFVILLVLVCLLAVVYLTQVTRANSYSYRLDSLNDEKTELQENFASLEVESARLQSLERIKQSQVAQQLVEPTNITYAN